MTDLRTPPTYDGEHFHERVRDYAHGRPLRRLRILDAACGRHSGFELGPADCEITGVDLDLPEVRARIRERRDLDAWHLGDLRTVPMPPRAYDVVHAPHVIDRIAHAELVLDRFVAALRPGGLMLVRFRDRDSVLGRLDRVAPVCVRTLLWPDEPPRHPAYEPIASLAGMRAYCLMRGLIIAEEHTARETVTGRGRLVGAVCRAVAAVPGTRLTAEYSDVSMVIRKPENRFARLI